MLFLYYNETNITMKQIIREEILRKHFQENIDIRFSDLPKDIQDTDIIHIHDEEAFFSENNSYDAYSELIVIREREETDEECQKRIDENKEFSAELKAKRYQTYLKLKKEFEDILEEKI